MPKALIVTIVAAIALALLWLFPAVGFIAAIIMIVLIAPWGRFLSERMVITGIVVLGLIAIVFPRASDVPLTAVTSRILISAILIVFLLVSFALSKQRSQLLPSFTWLDLPVLAVFAIACMWPISVYLGADPQQILSSLFYGGWDNAAHFLTFANTYEQERTFWQTIDGTVAWNQWYPSLQTTAYAFVQQAAGIGGLNRLGLLFPYTVWSAVSFAASMATLTWVAGDLAHRWLGSRATSRAALAGGFAAASATGAWALLGSPQFLLNAGFVNFLMGVAIVVAAGYISARSWRSARILGWFVIPFAAVSAIGLWTPLALFLVPAGVIVVIALWRWNARWAVTWLIINAALAGWLAWTQISAILFALDESTVAEFGEHIGRVGTGMAQFNLGFALVTPIVAIGAAALLRKRTPLSVAVATPAIAGAVLAILFSIGSSAAGTSLLRSYYVLKSLDAALLGTVPILAAMLAVGAMTALQRVERTSAWIAATVSGVVILTMFGYVGAAPQGMSAGFQPAPGVQASWVRSQGINDDVIGESILAGVRGGQLHPDAWPLLWDGSGHLPNLWVAGLSGVLTAQQSRLYADIGNFPYGDEAASVVRDVVYRDPQTRIAVVWFRGVTGDYLQSRLGSIDPRRLFLVRERVQSPALCEDC